MRIKYLIFLSLLSNITLAQPSGDSPELKSSVYPSNIYSQNGKMGLQRSHDKPLTPAVYDTLFKAGSGSFITLRYNPNKKQSLWGIIDAKGEILLPNQFRKLEIKNSLIIAGLQKQNRIFYGAYSLSGEELIAPKYEAINVLNYQYLAIQQKEQTIIFNHLGSKIAQLKADSITLLNSTIAKYFINGKVGIYNLHSKIAEPVSYKDAKINNDTLFVKELPNWTIYRNYDTLEYRYEDIMEWGENLIVRNTGKSWIIKEENTTISLAYDSIIEIGPTLALVTNNKNWGAIDQYGKEIIAVRYQHVMSDGEMIYTRDTGIGKKWAILDKYGFLKTKFKYDSILSISQGRIGIKRNNKWGFLDRYGVEIISPIFDAVQPFKDDLSIVTFFGEDGIINRQGKWIVPPTTLKILDYANNTFIGKTYEQYQVRSISGSELIYFTNNDLRIYENGFIESDSTGQTIRYISWNGTFETIKDNRESTMAGGAGLIIFKNNNRYGFNDQQGRIVIANRYDAVKPFHQRLAAIMINDKWGFINLEEQIIVQPQLDSVGNFSGNLCIVKKNGLLGVINLSGRTIVPTQFKQIELLGNGKLLVKKEDKWGILNENGSVVIHPKYSKLIPINENLFIVQRNNKYGIISSTGVNKMPLEFDYIEYSKSSKAIITKQRYKNEWTFLRKVHSSTL